MFLFKEWIKLREAFAVDTKMVSGPGIDLLKNTFSDMGGRGAPTEYDDQGFNKQDYTNFLRLSEFLSEKEIPQDIAIKMLEILSHYRNTQVNNYNKISDLVSKDLLKNVSHNLEKIQVFDKQELVYGKLKVYVPKGISRSSIMAINKVVDKYLLSKGEQKTLDNFGNLSLPRHKIIQKDRNALHGYTIHPVLINEILEILKNKEKLEVEFESGSTSFSSKPSTTSSSQSKSSIKKDIIILGEEENRYGKKLAIKFNIPFEQSKSIFDSLKKSKLTPSGISYAGSSRFLINIENISLFKQVKEEISKFIDVTPLDEFEKTIKQNSETPDQTQTNQASSNDNLIYFEEERENKVKIKVNYRMLDETKKIFIKESIQYTFPNYTWDRADYSYVVQGNYKQYISFGRLLKKFGYNVEKLKEIIRNKINNRSLSKTDWEGQHDDDEEFFNKIEQRLPNSNFDLYDQQKKGIAFLYGRNHAILGDETGLGKTVQLISAAELKMQSVSRPTLIITLKATQNQWVREIINVVGEEEKNNISTDPANPKKWTVVYYENFSSGKKVNEYVSKLSSANFGIAILDELHKVKHSKSKRSQNISNVTKDIPVKWGASATVSSNKPMDVKNQLKMTGHPLGEVSDSKFKKDFAGMTPTGYGGAYEESENEEDRIKAAERLNKWLNLSGVYVRRSKSDIREMPNLTVKDETTEVDQNDFSKKFRTRISKYKDPNLPISKLIAARETVSQLKTNETTNKVANIVKSKTSSGEMGKVVVFTNFVESGRLLVEKIQRELENINSNFYTLTYLSDTSKKDRLQVKQRFTDDPNAKVLVMSMRMGGTGIDFPNAAQDMVINDFDWTPESAEQSEGRIYRINTNKPVEIKYVVSKGLDEDLYRIVQKKRKLASIIQKYRREYQNSEQDGDSLDKIVSAQKEINNLDKEMMSVMDREMPKMEEKNESFISFLNLTEEISSELFASIYNYF